MPDSFTFFGQTYAWRDLTDSQTRNAFLSAAFATRDVADVANAHGLRDVPTRPSGLRDDSEGSSNALGFELAQYDRLFSQLEALLHAIRQAQRQLYVAEFGPLSDPYSVFGSEGNTEFDRVAGYLQEVIADLTFVQRADWEAMDADSRRNAVWMWQREARSATCKRIIAEADFFLTSLWRVARIACRLVDRPEREQRVIIDGSYLFGRLGYLVRRSHADTAMIDGYPMADRVPGDALSHEEWTEYAALLDELIQFVGQDLKLNDRDVVRTLDAAQWFARQQTRLTAGGNEEGPVFVDGAEWSATYKYLRNAAANAIREVLPDRKALWVEPPAPAPASPVIQDRSASPHADGPEPPTSFWWNNAPATLPPTPWKLLRYLWDVRSAEVEVVEAQVWGDEATSESRLKMAVYRVNEALNQVSCPLIVSQANGFVTLK